MNSLARWMNALLDRFVGLRLVRVATLQDIDNTARSLQTRLETAQAGSRQLLSALEAKTARIDQLEGSVSQLEEETSRLEEERSRLQGEASRLQGETSRLEGDISQLKQRIVVLEEEAEQKKNSVERIMDVEGSHDMQSRIIKLGRMLRPKKALQHDKIRIGDHVDGGYILLNDLQNVASVLSLGVAQEVSFDLQLAEMGAHVFQFDHSVEGPPIRHDRFKFEKVRIVADENDDGRTLKEIADQYCSPGGINILKIDIEADEWPILDATPAATLAGFSQIVCEFHWFGQIVAGEGYEQALRVFEKLNNAFEIVHIHANNFGGFSLRGNVPFPEVLEITFAARDRYACGEDSELLPTALDAPNDPKSPDLWLGHFQF